MIHNGQHVRSLICDAPFVSCSKIIYSMLNDNLFIDGNTIKISLKY